MAPRNSKMAEVELAKIGMGVFEDDGEGIPLGALPLRWVLHPEDVLEYKDEQPKLSLVCEECEERDGFLWSAVDSEVLCFECCQLLYPNTSTGEPHWAFTDSMIRFTVRADRSSAQRATQANDFYADVITAEKWEELGRDLRQPTAVEAPKKNPINSTSRSNRPLQKFTEGDIVVFDVEDQLPTEIQGHCRLPPWRNREIWGKVMGTAHPRLGQYGHAVRDGDEAEPFYRIRCMRWVSVSSKVGEGGLCSVYATEMAEADDIYEQRHLLDRKKEQLKHDNVKMKDFKSAPFARERSLAWIRDRQIKASISKREFAYGEMEKGEQADSTSFPTVVLLAESNVWAPAEKRAALVRRRAHQCSVVLRIVDGLHYEQGLIKSFFQWLSVTFTLIEEEREKAAVRLQHFALDIADRRALRNQHQLMMAEQTKGKHVFHFLRTPEEKKSGFTTDGKRYFATLHECGIFNKLWQEAADKTAGWIKMVIRKDRSTALNRWRTYVNRLKKLDRVPVTHLGQGHVGNEVAPLSINPFNATSARPWHPAVGIDSTLPPLPKMFSHRDTTGNIVVYPNQQNKFNSYRALTSGPSDTSNWVIPGKVLTGAYPEGKARRKGRQPTPPSALAQILLTGVGTVVCVMTPQEKQQFETQNSIEPLESAISKEHQHIKSWLKGVVVKMQDQASNAQSEVACLPVYSKSDQRYLQSKAAIQEAVAKERIAFAAADRAKAAYAKVPADVKVIYFDVEEGEVPELEQLITLLESIEARMRDASLGGVYICSRKGHGRSSIVAASLLGRLYGIKYCEVLERIQSYHDCRVSVIVHGKAIPALQTVAQAALVQQVLVVNETLYGTVQHREGKPTNEKGQDIVMNYPKMRGKGLPVILPPQQQREKKKLITEPEDGVVKIKEKAVKPVLKFPQLHKPTVASNRDLRYLTVMDEEANGPGIATKVRTLDGV